MTVTIPLTKGRAVVVDDCDADLALRYRWYVLKCTEYNVYAFRHEIIGGKTRRISMHREIMGVTRGVMVDHIDGNGLNNCRNNLRACSHAENMRNSRQRGVFLFPYKGIEARRRLFRAEIRAGGKKFRSRCYSTPEMAARAYDALALEHHGEFACLNFPGEPIPDEILSNRPPDRLGRQYIGVYLQKSDRKFAVEIVVNWKRIRMHGFETPVAAAQAYDDLALKHRGEFARLNFPDRAKAA